MFKLDSKAKAQITLIVYTLILVLPFSKGILISLIKQFTTSGFWINFYVYLIPILVTLTFYGKEVLKEFSYFKEKTLKKILLALGLFFSIQVLNYLMSSLSNLLGGAATSNQQAVAQASSQGPLILTILIFVVLGPLVEEVIFRRILIKEASNYVNEKVMILISWLGFILIHVHAPIDVLSYLPVATVLTWAYLKNEKNLAYSWTVHMLNNAFAVLFPILLHSL